MEIVVCIVCSIATSIITTKALATHYFKIVDGYVEDVCNKTKDFVETTESKIMPEMMSSLAELISARESGMVSGLEPKNFVPKDSSGTRYSCLSNSIAPDSTNR